MRRSGVGGALGAAVTTAGAVVAIVGLGAGCGSDAPADAQAEAGAAPTSARDTAGENQVPVIDSLRIEPREPAPGATLRAVAIARDPEGQPLRLNHLWSVNGEEKGSDAMLVLGAGTKGADVSVSVTASDGVHESEASEASVRVIDRPPSLTSVALAPEGSVTPGQPVAAAMSAADPDGDPIDYEITWYVNGERVDASGTLLETDALRQGDAIQAEVRATDGANWTRPKRTAVLTVGSTHPEITSNPPGFREDGEFRYEVVAVDPDGDKRLRYSLAEAPAGMVIDSVIGALVWRPRADQKGEFPVSIVVRDSTGLETTQSFQVTVRDSGEDEDTPPAADAP